ncbi:MAG: flagellar basal body-associated FliL family protein, partial [Cellulosilyticaceae bacterium]
RMSTTQTTLENTNVIDSKNLELLNLQEPITVNIIDEIGKPHVARVVLALEVDNKNKGYKAFVKTFSEKEIVVRDAVITLLREQTYEMMSRVDAQEKLSDEIVVKVNELLGTSAVQNVYFGDFFVQ